MAEQHVYGREAENALNFRQAGFERAAQEDEQAARDEVHVAVAQATKMSGEELRERRGCCRKSSSTNLDALSSYAIEERDEWSRTRRTGKQRRSLLNEATAALQRHQGQSHEHPQECQQSVQRHLSQFQQVAS